jgi:hypothetical protein
MNHLAFTIQPPARKAKARPSPEYGLGFGEDCRRALQAAGFTVDRAGQFFADAGVHVDIVATNRQAISFYITCKGVRAGSRTGAPSATAFRKAVAQARALTDQGWGPVLLLAAHAAQARAVPGSEPRVDPEVIFDVLDPYTDGRRLRWLANADERQLRADLARRISRRPPEAIRRVTPQR